MLSGERRNVNGHFGTKKPLSTSRKHIFFENLKLAIFSDVLCLFVCLLVIAIPEWGCPGLPTFLPRT